MLIIYIYIQSKHGSDRGKKYIRKKAPCGLAYRIEVYIFIAKGVYSGKGDKTLPWQHANYDHWYQTIVHYELAFYTM